MEHIKMVAVGDGMVGKTCMLMSFTTDAFPTNYVPTIFDNYQAMLMHNEKPMSVGFWDTAGQEDYDRLRPLSYPNTDVFLICYSVKSEISVNNILHRWIPEVRQFCPSARILVVGTKSDIRKNTVEIEKLQRRGKKLVDFEQVRAKMLEAGAHGVIETSAKTRHNLTAMVGKGIDLVLEQRKKTKKKSRRKQVCAIL